MPEDKSSVDSLLQGLYVRQNGRIFPYGVIRVLSKIIVDDDDDDSGAEFWSKAFVKYGDGSHYAEISDSSQIVHVFRKGIGKGKKIKKVNEIPFKEIKSADVWTVQVGCHGFLHAIGRIGAKFSNDAKVSLALEEALCKAAKGIKPGRFDNSTFIQVDASLAGQTLVEIDLGHSCDEYRVFTQNGKPVACEAKAWLSYDKWSQTPPLIRHMGLGGIIN